MVSAPPRGDLAAPSGAKRPRNATSLVWSASAGPPEHVNGERDVLIFVAGGSATVNVDGEERELAAGEALIVGKGRRRRTLDRAASATCPCTCADRRSESGWRASALSGRRARRVAEVGRSLLGTPAREELSRLGAAIPESCSGTVTGAQVAESGRRRRAPPIVRTAKPMPLRSSAMPTTKLKSDSRSAM